MSEQFDQHRSDGDQYLDARRSVRRWRLIALGAFAAGAVAMAAVPATAEPRPDHEGASVRSTATTTTTTVSAEECADAAQQEADSPALSNTGGTVPGYVYSGGSWGSADGDVPDGATE